MNSRDATRLLKGRRIVRVAMRAFRAGRMTYLGKRPNRRSVPEWAHDPVIYLDDGTVLTFVTQETDVGDYGVELVVTQTKGG